MPRNNLTKEEMKYLVLKQKNLLNQEDIYYTSDPKSLANKYLNNILDKLEEYRF